MGFPLNGDIIPTVSGRSSLGVELGVNGPNDFDHSNLRPYGHIHQISGVFHDPIMGESGVIRFNREQACMEVSVDGGLTFGCIATDAGVVTSVGVLGDVNLAGNVDFASPASGFIVIQDTGDASPLLWSVDVHALSGLWNFPMGGFDTIPQCYAETFTAATSWVATHGLGTEDVQVLVLDASSPRVAIIPDEIEITDANNVTIGFNVAQAGRIIIQGC